MFRNWSGKTVSFLAFWRSPDYGFTRLFQHISIALIVGLTVRSEFPEEDDENAVLERSERVVDVQELEWQNSQLLG
jgi:hypothetical protein